MTAVAQPSGTVTLVFTDIEGSTRLLDELGPDAYREALLEHRRIVRDSCARHAGYEVDCEGDAFFYAFQSAQEAVAAVSEAMAGLDGGPIRIRVGIHTGEPRVDAPKYVGLDVHRAARIMAAAHGGQVLLSAATVALVERVRFVELGFHRLKDLNVAEHVFQLGDSRFPPIRSLTEANVVASRRRRLTVLLGLIGSAALVAGAVLLSRAGSELRLDTVDAGSLGVVDPESGRIVGQVPLGASPRRLAFGAGAVWATTGADGISIIDPATRSLERRIDVGGFAVDVAVGEREAWVVVTRGSSLLMELKAVDPEFGADRDALDAGVDGRAGIDIFSERSERIAIENRSIWLTNAGTTSTSASVVSKGGTLRRISRRSGRLEETLALGRVKELLVTGPSIWAAEIGAVIHVDRAAGTTDRISLASTAVPNGIAAGHGAIWVATGPLIRGTRLIGKGAVTRIDPRTNAVTATIPVDGNPRGIATTVEGVWVTDRSKGRLLRIDPRANRIAETVGLGNSPEDIVVVQDQLWVAVP